MSDGLPVFAVIDFETTGSSMSQGARATEIGVVRVLNGQILDRYQSLMQTGAWVSPFIEELTGISNAMVREAPLATQVMQEASFFAADCVMVAHNASFDRVFWRVERKLAACHPAPFDEPTEFICTLMLSRRLYPELRSHRLGALVASFGLPDTGRAHRALADAEATAHLFVRIVRDVEERFAAELAGRPVCPDLLRVIQQSGKKNLSSCVAQFCQRQGGGRLQASKSAQQVGVS
jgi:DNA polymerase-3 subunit epsilon